MKKGIFSFATLLFLILSNSSHAQQNPYFYGVVFDHDGGVRFQPDMPQEPDMVPWKVYPDLDLHAVAPDGRHIGVNYKTGEFEVQIPDAIVSSDNVGPEWIFVPSTVTNVRFYISARDNLELQKAYNGFPKDASDLFEAYARVIVPQKGIYTQDKPIENEKILPGEEKSFFVQGIEKPVLIRQAIQVSAQPEKVNSESNNVPKFESTNSSQIVVTAVSLPGISVKQNTSVSNGKTQESDKSINPNASAKSTSAVSTNSASAQKEKDVTPEKQQQKKLQMQQAKSMDFKMRFYSSDINGYKEAYARELTSKEKVRLEEIKKLPKKFQNGAEYNLRFPLLTHRIIGQQKNWAGIDPVTHQTQEGMKGIVVYDGGVEKFMSFSADSEYTLELAAHRTGTLNVTIEGQSAKAMNDSTTFQQVPMSKNSRIIFSIKKRQRIEDIKLLLDKNGDGKPEQVLIPDKSGVSIYSNLKKK